MNPIDARMAELAAVGRYGHQAGRGIGEIALERVAEAPDKVVVVDGQRVLSRAELLDAALRLGGALRARGLERGAVIAFQLPNWWEACAISLCAGLFGYRLVPLLTIYRAAELGHILPVCGVDAIFAPEEVRGKRLARTIAELEVAPGLIFRVRGASGDDNTFEALLGHAPGTPDPAPVTDAKIVIFTSGSTGRPKGVIHTHAAIDVLIRDTAAFWGVGEEDRLYVPSPIAHVGGGLYAFEFTWITGCSAVLEDVWEPARAVRRIDGEGLTFMAGATPFLSGLLEASQAAGSGLPSLRRFICGGASVPPELVRQALERFPAAVVSRAYGSSEVPLVCPGMRGRDEAEIRADTDGECTAEVRLLDDFMNEVPPGGEGEIAVRAPQMLVGYLDASDEADAFCDDGFFRMGDLGRLSGGRFLTITGRKKDIIIRKGENISPLEIETVLAHHPEVAACAVVGRPDPERGEMVVAFVVARAGGAFDFDCMVDHLDAAGLARQKFPEELAILAELPMNTVGKVQKDVLRKMAVERVGTGGAE